MPMFKKTLLGAVASVFLLGGAGAAFAQNRTPDGAAMRTIQVPAGAVVIVLPSGPVMPFAPADLPADQARAAGGQQREIAFPMGGMPDAFAMMRQMEQMMNQSDAVFDAPLFSSPDRLMQAAMQQFGTMGAGAQGVVVTSFSDGHGSCTRRVVYSGNGAPQVQVSATGGASCGPLGGSPLDAGANAPRPAASPDIRTPMPSGTRTLRVENRVKPATAQPRLLAENFN